MFFRLFLGFGVFFAFKFRGWKCTDLGKNKDVHWNSQFCIWTWSVIRVSLGRHNKGTSCKSMNDETWKEKFAQRQGPQKTMGNLKQ